MSLLQLSRVPDIFTTPSKNELSFSWSTDLLTCKVPISFCHDQMVWKSMATVSLTAFSSLYWNPKKCGCGNCFNSTDNITHHNSSHCLLSSFFLLCIKSDLYFAVARFSAVCFYGLLVFSSFLFFFLASLILFRKRWSFDMDPVDMYSVTLCRSLYTQYGYQYPCSTSPLCWSPAYILKELGRLESLPPLPQVS